MPPFVPSFLLAASSLFQATPAPAKRLDTSGILLLTLSISSVLTLVVYCYRRVLTQPPPGAEERKA